jgi:hypothetical protein
MLKHLLLVMLLTLLCYGTVSAEWVRVGGWDAQV